MPRASGGGAVLQPNLGLWFNTPLLSVPDGALSAGENFRIKNGSLTNANLGWSSFSDVTLNGAVTFIDAYFNRDGNQVLVFGTGTDLYQYDAAGDTVAFLTPVYATGTVDVSAATPAVVTDASGSPMWQTAGAKAGDQISFGAADETDPDATWYTIATVDAEDQLTLTTAVTGAPLSGEAYTLRLLFTGDLDTPWETVTFLHEAQADEDLMIFTNGVDDIVTWNGTDDHAQSAGLGFKANHLALYKNMVIYSAITESGEFMGAQIRNSDVGDPLELASGLAGAFTVHEGSDEVDATVPMGDSLVLYSARHIIMADFVGDPFIFVFRTAVPNLGPLSGRLVGDFGDTHVFIGPDAAYEFNGVTVAERGGQAWRDILRMRDPTRPIRAWSHFDEENGDLLWVLPLADDGTEAPAVAWVEHYLEDTGRLEVIPVSKRAMPFTASGFFERATTLTFDQISETWEDLNFRWNDIFFSAAFPFNLVGDVDGNLWTLNTSQTAAGTPLPSYVRTGRRPTGDGVQRNLITRVVPFASYFPEKDLQVRVRISDSAAGPVTIADEQILDQTLGEDAWFTSHWRVGRYYELEFAQDAGTVWEVNGWSTELRPGGRR